MNTPQNAAQYVSETVQGTGAEASKEGNKNVAKDNSANVTTRASAAKDAMVDKKDELSHNTKADVNKGKPSQSTRSLTCTDIDNFAEAAKQ